MKLFSYIAVSTLSSFIFYILYFIFAAPNGDTDITPYGLISILLGVIIGILLSINSKLTKTNN